MKSTSTGWCSSMPQMLMLLGGLWLVSSLSLAATHPSNQDTSPAKCTFENSSSGIKAYCSHLGLTTVPQDFPQNVIVLDLDYNNLTSLQNDSFQDVPSLVTLSLTRNRIAVLASGTFTPLTRLKVLILTYNKLVTMPSALFIENKLLTNLRTDDNDLQEIPRGAVTTLTRLTSVYFGRNKIKRLNFGGFDVWPHLRDIALDGNNIEEIQRDDFLPLENTTITNLNLNTNKLQNLPPYAFQHLSFVQNLLLSGNQITSLDIQPFLGAREIQFINLAGANVHELGIINLTSHMVDNLPVIMKLDLRNNYIETVPNGVLEGFGTLQTLILVKNRISTISSESFCSLIALTELDISSNRFAHLPNESFACMNKLAHLNVSGNHLSLLSPQSFHGMSSILSLDLSHNLMGSIAEDSWDSQTLQWLDVSHNLFKFIRKNHFGGLPQLRIMNISYNIIENYQRNAFINLSKLQQLSLTNEKATFLNGAFQNLTGLQFLDLSNAEIQISLDTIEQFVNATSLTELRMETAKLVGTDLYDNGRNKSLFTGLRSLENLRLKGNNLKILDFRVFHNLSRLITLDMTSSNIRALPSGVFSDLKSLRYLKLSNNQLRELNGDIFQRLFQLSVLYIQNNTVQSLETEIFAGNPNLKQLYLPGNQISIILPGTVLPGNTSLIFDISRNPFSCTCSLRWFREWLQSADIVFKHAKETTCSRSSLKGLANLPILSFEPDDYCGVNIIPIISCSLAGVFLGLLLVIAYNKRWWVNYKFFLLKLAILGYQEMNEDFDADHYEFHLNLMFHEEDEEWVNRVMRPALEERLPRIQNVIFGDEDLHLGMFYINAIYDAIDNSFKTVLLVSNRCVEDAWFMTKLRLALEHVNDTGLDKVLLIFLEDIADENLPYLVRLFLSRNRPYMLWTEDEEAQDFFWAQFEKSMRTNRAINNVIPI